MIKKVGLNPVKTAAVLLGQTKRQILLSRIKRTVSLEEAHYDALYQPVIEQFVEFAQVLPRQVGGKLGGLMDCGLVRANLALQALQEENNPQDALYTYVIFTTALLRDLSKLISQQQVMICDQDGQYLSDWLPFEGSLLARADFYKVRFLDDRWLSLGKAAAPLLARQIMPEVGFLWIAENFELFQRWLSVFTGEGSRELEPIRHLLELTEKEIDHEIHKLHLPDLPIEVTYPQETALGENFLAWLAEGVEKNTLAVNQPDAFIHALESGEIFLDKQIFNLFCQRYALRVDWLTILKQVNRLGLTKPGINPEGELFYANYHEKVVKSKMSYFLTGQPSDAKKNSRSGASKTGLAKVLQGTLINRPELITAKLTKIQAQPLLSLKQVTPPEQSAQLSERSQLAGYLKRVEVKQLKK